MASQPTKIGKYDVVRVIGRGGMGMVYQAIDPTIGRMVAIKRVTAVLSDDPELLKRFYREAKSTGQLQHPNIVTLYGLGDQDGVPYLVMEYLEGDSLEKIIREHRPYTLAEKLNIIIQACEGLAYAHHRHIIHRDVKPGNIVVLNDGGVKIVDFGIAQLGNERFTRTGQVVGSLYYMSPEQIQDADVDSRSDIYSIGVVLFEFLSGALPYQGKDPTSTLAKILNDAPPSLAKYVPVYPPDLDDVLRRAMARDRNERYASMEDLLFDLRTVQEALSRELIAGALRAAENCIASRDWERAREQLRQVLTLDKQHRRANELLREVHAQVQRQHLSEQVSQLRQGAEEALSMRNWDEALRLLDQAVKLDAGNKELAEYRDSIRRSSTLLAEALRRAEALHDAGDLEGAKQAVEKALTVDPANTTAKALNAILSKELSERAKRKKVDEYIVGARKEIALRHFTSALELLRGAEAIDPSVAEVQQLIRSAAAGRESERRRLALEKACAEIEELLHRDQYIEACEKADQALLAFPQDLGLLKLKGFAERQRDAWSRHQYIESQSASARQLADSGQLLKAQSVLNEALERYPDDSGLISLLGIVSDGLARQEAQRREAERLANEKRRYIRLQLEAAADLQRAGQTHEAVKKIREGLFHYPDSEELKNQIVALDAVLAREEAARQKAEQEARQRKAEVEKLIADTWQLLSKNQTGEAVGILEQALRRYPQNEDLKSQLEFANRRLAVEQAEKERIEQEARRRREDLQKETAAAQQMLDARQTMRAIAALEQALGRYPDSEELKSLLLTAQRRQAAEQAERERAEKQARQRLAEIEQVIMTARQLLDARRTRESVECLEQALRRYPGSEELRMPLEYAKQRLAAEESAREKAAGEERRRREWIESEIVMARQWLDDRQADRAVASLQQALQRYPESPELKAQLETAERRAALERAERERADQAARQRREEIDREIAGGRDLMSAGKTQEAVTGLEKALFKFPDSKELRLQFEMAKRRREEEEDEKRRAEEAKRRRQEEIEHELQSATQLLNLKQTIRAVSTLETVFLKYPDNAELKSQLEIARKRLAEEQAEREKAAKEARRKQELVEKEMAKARILLDSGKTSQAVTSLEESVRRIADSEPLKLQLELARQRLADEESAKALAEEEKRRRKAAIVNAVSMAQQLLDSNQNDRAVTTLQQALRSYPESEELKTLSAEAQKRWAAEKAEQARLEEEARRRQAEIDGEIHSVRQLLDSKQTSQAIAALGAAANRFPDSSEIKTLLEFARQRLAREEEERRQAEEQARRRQAEIESQIALGRQSLDSNQNTQAFALLESATRKYPESDGLRSLYSEARERIEKNRAERERLEREAQARKQSIAAEIETGKRLLKAKDTDRAVSALEAAVQNYPESDELRSVLSAAKEQRAREAAERAEAQRKRAQLESEKSAIRSLLDSGKPDEALQAVEAALRTFVKEADLLQLQKAAKVAAQKLAQQKKEEEKRRTAEQQKAEEQRRRRERDLSDLRKLAVPLPAGTKPSAIDKTLQKARSLAAAYPKDEEVREALSKVEAAVKPAPVEKPEPRPVSTFGATRVFVPGRHEQTEVIPVLQPTPEPEPVVVGPAGILEQLRANNFRNKWTAIGAGALVVILIGIYLILRKPPTPPLQKTYTVNFLSNPSGAIVQLGDQKCVTPNCSLSLQAGENQVHAEKEGDLPTTQSVIVDANNPITSVTLDLTPIETAGYLVIKAGIAGAGVIINGKRRGVTDSSGSLRVGLEPAPYTVEVQKEGYESEKPQKALVTKGSEIPLVFNLKPLPTAAQLTIKDAPANAEVHLDGLIVGTIGPDGKFSQSVDPGEHDIALVNDGQRSSVIHKRLAASKRVELDGKKFVFPPKPPPPPTTVEAVIKNLPAGAEVRVDGGEPYKANTSGVVRFKASLGDHKLEISADGYQRRTFPAIVCGGCTVDGTMEKVDAEAPEWAKIENSSDMVLLQQFVLNFPNGTHAEQAQSKVDRLIGESTSEQELQIFYGHFPSTRAGFAARRKAEQMRAEKNQLTDRDKITGLLGRLGQAYANKDIGEICAIWPQCPRPALSKVFKDATVSERFDPVSSLQLGEGVANGTYKRTIISLYKKGDNPSPDIRTVLVKFRKQGADWQIESIE